MKIGASIAMLFAVSFTFAAVPNRSVVTVKRARVSLIKTHNEVFDATPYYWSTPQTFVSGYPSQPQTDVNGNTLVVTPSTTLANYLYLSKTTTTTFTGYFVTAAGVQCSAVFSYAVPVANGSNVPVSWATMYGSALPSTAVSFYGTSNGTLYVSKGSSYSSDFQANYANYPTLFPYQSATTIGGRY